MAELRDRIVTGQLPPGTRLLQEDLAKELQVSRTPLREAFRVLENERYLSTSNHNRTVEVVTLSPDDLRDMYQLREVIDGLAARLASQRGLSTELQSEARELLDDMSTTSASPFDPLRRTKAHGAFHSLIVRASGNSQLQGLEPLIRRSASAFYLPFVNDPAIVQLAKEQEHNSLQKYMNDADDQHEAILAAVLDGDAEEAERLAQEHARRGLTFVSSIDSWRQTLSAVSTP
ncbi:MAG TPA: GntR family transcriptional regulator [Terrimesophilobacter sp.]|nr:GntR family transcriptional regulator [Terrimesophilobacter sp.]